MSFSTYNIVSTHYTTHVASQSPASHSRNTLVASAFGYSVADLASTPTSANLGVSCGNPLATAGLKEGETIIDLGSGAGLDCFLASARVGESGRVFGVDMTESMLALAERNKERGDYSNVNANITSIPLPDGEADIVTSNCVINLVPSSEKAGVFREIYRLLKPGGRVAISDILARKRMPDEVRNDARLYVACVSSASEVVEYERWIQGAGFKDLFIIDTEKDLNVYKEGILSLPVEQGEGERHPNGCCGTTPSIPAVNGNDVGCKERLENLDLNEYVGAYQIYAIKRELDV